MKNFYYVILSMITITLVSCTSELDDMNNTVHQQETLLGNELGANLMKSFQNAVSRSSDIKHLSYPSYYGGAYLNKEGRLIVRVVNRTSKEIENDLTIRCGGNGAIMDICEYSYSDLLNAAEKMDSYLLSKNKIDNPFEFYGFSICDTDNNIEVYLGDISESNIQNFKKEVLEEPFLKFVKSEKPTFLSEILTGQSIVSGTRSYGSVGFRAKRKDSHVVPVTGFVTAGHVVKEAGTYVYEDESMSTPIGCTEISQTSGDTDAAFCYSMNGYTFSNYLYSDFFIR